jgi:hypothetical protein
MRSQQLMPDRRRFRGYRNFVEEPAVPPATAQPGLDHPAPCKSAPDTGRGAEPQDAWVDGSVVRSLLETAVDAFEWLVTGPAPLSLRGVERPSLPRRAVLQHHLCTRLAAGQVRPRDRAAIWAACIFWVRTSSSPSARTRWTWCCVGVGLPSWVPMTAGLPLCYPADPADIEAAFLSAFLPELRRTSTRAWTGDGLRSCFSTQGQYLDRGLDR